MDVERALFIVNLSKKEAPGLAERIAEHLEARGTRTARFSFEGKPVGSPDLEGSGLVICLGGDGTVLYSSRMVVDRGIPLFPINFGRLGFIAETGPDDWRPCLDAFLDDVAGASERIMLDMEILRDGRSEGRFKALNDGVISLSGIARIVNLGAEVDGEDLGTYMADGMIIATPTGSTAYSLSAGGPILDPEMDALIMNPICPFTLSNRPLVLPGESRIVIEVKRAQRGPLSLTVDGQESAGLEDGDLVIFRRAARRVRIVGSRRRTFLRVLRAKLNWSGGPDA